MAADSAVTVGRDKVHISANKIFSVSDSCPIGCMIYGNAEFASIPWETLIKLFRTERGDQKFLTVQDCRDDFFEYLKGDRFLTEETITTSFVLFTVSVAEQIKDVLEEMPARERGQKLEEIIKEKTEEFINHKVSAKCDVPEIKSFSKAHKADIRLILNEVFEEISYKYPARLDALMVDMIYAAFTSGYVSEYHSGIVFFGFGESDLLPAITRDELDGAPFKSLRLREDLIGVKDIGKQAAIIPFADTEVMTSFMEGATKEMQATCMALLFKTSEEVAKRVVQENFSLSESEYKTVEAMNRTIIQKIVEESITALRDEIHARNIAPVMRAVGSLPKDDMAKLAEALVEVTALKKKVSPLIESVGGPIDVCIVTKGDGLIWIKRKHYFDLAKNLQYVSHRRINSSQLLLGGTNGKS